MRNHKSDSLQHYLWILLMIGKEAEFEAEALSFDVTQKERGEIRRRYQEALADFRMPEERKDDITKLLFVRRLIQQLDVFQIGSNLSVLKLNVLTLALRLDNRLIEPLQMENHEGNVRQDIEKLQGYEDLQMKIKNDLRQLAGASVSPIRALPANTVCTHNPIPLRFSPDISGWDR